MPVPAGGTNPQESGRLIGPDEAYRVVFLQDGRARARGYPVPLFADEAGSIPADVLTVNGDDVPESTLIVDVHSRIPLFQYPPGSDVVYTSINGGPIVPLYARVDDRIDKLADSVAGVGDDIANAVAAEAANRAAAITAAIGPEQAARVAGDNALSARLNTVESATEGMADDLADVIAAVAQPPRIGIPGATGLPGQYFLVSQGSLVTVALTGSFNILYMWPMYLTQAVSVDRACIEVTAVGTGVIRHGVYANNPANGCPVATGPIADFGTVDVSATGVKESVLSPAVQLPAGWHWYGLVWQGVNTTAPAVRSMNATSGFGPLNIGAAPSLMSGNRLGYFATPVPAALGTIVAEPSNAHQLTPPRVAYRRA
ncbi:hypothetical protein [Micromonospora costi]|uniref:Uncharacterized protein n=1 Tax=Micromonospora costi TaxID=1530042 RepID=A0A3B0A5Q5_9ACTN|nr:hypothetical protein [Micromonospora costi]RKN55945.1 hypothetical protein D7193_15275 [Micromonospora costi]